MNHEEAVRKMITHKFSEFVFQFSKEKLTEFE